MQFTGISFDELTLERIDAKVEPNKRSEWVREAARFRLEAEAELGVRGIHLETWDETTEFLLDRLEDGLDAWNA